jgi:hypothetical protein
MSFLYDIYLAQCAERDRARALESFEERRIADQERGYSGGETKIGQHDGDDLMMVEGLGGATYRRYCSVK